MLLFKSRPSKCPVCKATLPTQDALFRATPKCTACGTCLEPSFSFAIIAISFGSVLGLWLQYRFTVLRLLFAIALVLGFAMYFGTHRWKVQGSKVARPPKPKD